jgi:hypothetical protein
MKAYAIDQITEPTASFLLIFIDDLVLSRVPTHRWRCVGSLYYQQPCSCRVIRLFQNRHTQAIPR